ncbi:phage tail protein [Actinokineospora auranticolor]|uniref:Phage tail-like protein n=1 Tax=Actinokineospora auranticolor TaxID=155976 RepID=A0A2S6GR53_9PSEU|nr:phage tail protein [Actinokineospora auranticolor]PPK67653.1 phage tail-like protein [Actinokineospora auranticolor]
MVALHSAETQLALTTRFHVAVDGVDLGGWARCQGLQVKFNPELINDGGNYEYEVILPGRVQYPNVTLTRAMNAPDTARVQAWLRDRVSAWIGADSSGDGGTAQITLFDARAGVVAAWQLRNVYPATWKGPDLDAMTLGIATETLELAHEGFL